MNILAIETSCDETAAAVIEKSGSKIRILSNVVASQINIHKKYGGVFPEIASRAHTEKIIPVVEQALSEVKSYQLLVIRKKSHTNNFITDNQLLSTVDCVAVTVGPGLIGSLLVGVNFAKTLSYSTGKPIIGVNHLLGHIYSNFVEDNLKLEIRNLELPNFPSLVLIVSGGHTGLYLMKSHSDIKCLGQTLDDAAGEAFDKAAKLLGLGYPGGPAIAAFAKNRHSERSEESVAYATSRIRGRSLDISRDDLKLPRPMINSNDLNFSFSGLKTALLYKIKELSHISHLSSHISAALAAEFQQAVVDILIAKTMRAALKLRPKSICLCGGVSANAKLRDELHAKIKKTLPSVSYHVPNLKLSTDNAAMIGIAAAYHFDDAKSWDKIHANANSAL